MCKHITTVLTFVLAISIFAVSAGPIPRKAPELSFYDSSGKAISLSSFKGKVVALEFLFIRSMHCVRVAQTLNKLGDELGARGLQPLGVAFSAPHSQADPATVDNFVQSYRLAFPIGYADKESVDGFLGRGENEILNIPQVVIIDRTGMIRAQTGAQPGDPKLEDGDFLRALLDRLLKEGAPAPTPAKPASPPKSGKAGTAE